MRVMPLKNKTAFPVPEEEADRYLESIFSSRFFSGGSRKERRDWIQTHFPSWSEEARRIGNEILRRENDEGSALLICCG